ncbi:MAG: hypothetical protein Q9174_000920 [Haloplaca sp. 1 TL-2023]
MGQESSTPVDEDTPPQTLYARTLDAVASYIKEGRAKKIVVMTGAGVSTAAGIPDFRSPDTGIYANLAKLDLPYPEAVFDISYFRSKPLPFYHLAHELYPGRYKPTISHCFIRLLADKGLLLKLFTQNIDCLERAAGVPDVKIVEAHGSFAHQRCIECRKSYPDDLMKQAIDRREVPHCLQTECQGLVKPDIVFFGEALPEDFHHNRMLPAAADLALIMGTSLTVQPFASLPGYCADGVPRVLVNQDRVGGLGSRADDVLILGDIDEGVRKLALAVGWSEELDALYRASQFEQPHQEQDEYSNKSPAETLDEEIDKIAKDVNESLRISEQHNSSVRERILTPKCPSPEPEASEGSLSEPRISTTGAGIARTEHQATSEGSSCEDEGATEETATIESVPAVSERKPAGPAGGKTSF